MNHKEAIKKCDELIARIQEMKKSIEEDANLTPIQRAAVEAAAELRKSRIRQDLFSKKLNPAAEEVQARQLAKMLESRGILGTRPPPRQPTDEEMFGHLIPSEEQVQKAEQQYNNPFGWMAEAMKPISSRFKSPQEEQAYWDNIRVGEGSDEGHSGY